LVPSASRAAFRRLPDPTNYTPGFSHLRDRLQCEDVPLASIVERVGTPVYVYSRAAIEGAFRHLDHAFASVPHTLCYAVKANSNLSILRLLARLGAGFDIVSGGEFFRLQRAHVSPRRVVFSGVGKTREELRLALRSGFLLLNVESEAELELLAEEASRLRRRVAAGIRVNPDVVADTHPHISTGHHQHKFGMDWAEARRLYRAHRHSRWIRWQGISAHIGSQILSLAPFRRAIGRLAEYARELMASGIALRFLDFGGGVGIRYLDETPLSIEAYAESVIRATQPLGLHLLLEPGRYLVGPAGVLLMRVLYVKHNRGKRFVIVDAAMNDFMRPALYGALHPITPVVRPRQSRRAPRRADIVGPVCETGDCFLRDWPIGEVSSGDLLVMWGTGAYGSVSATNYNTRLRPAEVLVEGSQARLIRRRESPRDLIRGEETTALILS
jgi:diaminopimelate decarboxylase